MEDTEGLALAVAVQIVLLGVVMGITVIWWVRVKDKALVWTFAISFAALVVGSFLCEFLDKHAGRLTIQRVTSITKGYLSDWKLLGYGFSSILVSLFVAFFLGGIRLTFQKKR